jgi:hypothetical protein
VLFITWFVNKKRGLNKWYLYGKPHTYGYS